jgi:DNA invertase Pin-like site-specific DNA recombinase
VKQSRRTVAYCRVSTEDQATHGVSLDQQRTRIEAYAIATGREVDEFIVDAGESAKSLRRPGMIRLLEGVKNGSIGAVIVLKLDRATRSVKDLLHLIEVFGKANADLVSVSESLDTSTASGRMVVQILGVMAEFERAQLSERTAGALAHKRRNRQVYGHAPFGFRREGDSLTEDSQEQWALSVARRMRVEGASLRRVAEWLEGNGFSPSQGGQAWRKQTVAQVLGSRIAAEA